MSKPKLRNPSDIIVKDALGLEWAVKESRSTKYGFDLLFGRRTYCFPSECTGNFRLIYTNELKAFWEKYAIAHDGTIFDLPAGRTTLKRARIALGFNWDLDSERFWRKRKPEMAKLKPLEFEEKYKDLKLTGNRMSFWRLRMVGAKARPIGWWKEPDVLKLLLSEMSLNQVRAVLGEEISTSQVFRLRRMAQSAFTIRNGNPVPLQSGREAPTR